MTRSWAGALALALCGGALGAQVPVEVTDRGPGASGRILAAALAAPHRLVEPDTGWYVLRRDEESPTTIVVLGRTAAIEGLVHGDVVVVGGDLFVRPGARITGRAIAIGGGAYPSTLAVVSQGALSFRDNTFVIARAGDGYRLAYHSLYEDATPPLTFPGVYGLRLPSYDRVNGLSVPVGPAFTFAGGRGALNATATWRSDLGKVDPWVEATLEPSRRSRVEARAGRASLSNDDWIWPDFLNSGSSLVLGRDTRNWYRADRAEATAHRLWETTVLEIEPFVGIRGERSWAVGPAVGERRGPWSVFGRTDTLEGMHRPNPAVPRLDALSALGGGSLRWEEDGLRLSLRATAERSVVLSARDLADPPGYTQVTSDLDVGFPTFGEQEYEVDVHWVTTPAGTAPPQRFAWLGGSGTMPFRHLLEQGGGELLLVDQRYSIPLLWMRLGLLGSPTLQLRHRLGAAGPDRLPALDQVIGLGLHVALVRGELLMDPATRATRFSVGFTFSR